MLADAGSEVADVSAVCLLVYVVVVVVVDPFLPDVVDANLEIDEESVLDVLDDLQDVARR